MFDDVEDITKRSFWGALTKGKLTGVSKLNTKESILKKINFFFHHTMCESPCDTLSSSADNQDDNTVSVAQGYI